MAWDRGALRADAAVAASQTDSAFIAATSPSVSAPLRVAIMGLWIVNGATGTSTLQLNSKGSGAGTRLTGFPTGLVLPAAGQLVLPFADDAWLIGNPGEAVTISTGAGNTTNAFFSAIFRYVP